MFLYKKKCQLDTYLFAYLSKMILIILFSCQLMYDAQQTSIDALAFTLQDVKLLKNTEIIKCYITQLLKNIPPRFFFLRVNLRNRVSFFRQCRRLFVNIRQLFVKNLSKIPFRNWFFDPYLQNFLQMVLQGLLFFS